MSDSRAPLALEVVGLRHAYGARGSLVSTAPRSPATASQPLATTPQLTATARRGESGGRREPVEVLRDLALEVSVGSTVAVLGPSGCGKSTLLRLIAGFERPTAGRISIGGSPVADRGRWVPAERRPIGYVAQEGALFPHLTVRGNLQFGLERAARGSRAHAVLVGLLDLVSLDAGFLDRYPHELSGGQQQRVALARTLARRPALVLLDEPFSALDTDLRAGTREAVARALRASNVTTVLVTHDRGEALSFADLVAVMVDGRFTQVGTPHDVYEHPVDVATARLVGGAVLVPGRLNGSVARTSMGEIPLRSGRPHPPERGHRGSSDGHGLVLLRPEQIGVRRDTEGPGVVTGSEYYGHDRLLEVRWPGLPEPFRARVSGGIEIRPDDKVAAVITGTGLAFPR